MSKNQFHVQHNTGLFSVVQLNESVVPTKSYEVPLGIKSIVQDGEFTYIGCDDGGLYGKSSFA